jgi:hypothetical protein
MRKTNVLGYFAGPIRLGRARRRRYNAASPALRAAPSGSLCSEAKEQDMKRATYRLGILWLAALSIAASASCAPGARADHIEKREYTIFINQKDAGRLWLRMVTKDNGIEEVTGAAEAAVKIGPFTGYSYKAETAETWKDGRLMKLHTVATEDKKTTSVSATADGKQLLLQVNGKNAGTVSPEVWVSSYWKLADKKFHNKSVPILDSDTGKELNGKLEFKGTEPVKVGGKVEDCYLFQVTGIPIEIKLWYDRHHRLVRQEFTEKGCPTIIQLDAIRR